MNESIYHIVITDNRGHLLADARILSDNLLNAGIIAEKISEHYHKKESIINRAGEIKIIKKEGK